MKTSKSLSRQLMAYAFVFTYLVLISFWSVLFFTLKRNLQAQDEDLIQDRVHTITSLLQVEHGPSWRLSQRIEKEWFERLSERILVRVLNDRQETVAETPHLSEENVRVLQNLHAGSAPRAAPQLTRLESGPHVFETTVAEALINGQQKYRIEIALERTSEQSLLAIFRTFFIYLLILGGAASLWIGRSIAKLALRPIREMSMVASRINSERLNERFDQTALPREYHEVAATMNDMLDRLRDSFDRLTRFSEDMAHELRTPVNNLLGTMQVALAHNRSPEEYRNTLGSSIEECERLKRILDSLLFIARSADPNQNLERQNLNLDCELSDIVSFYEASAEEKHIRIELVAEEGLTLQGERTHFQRCIGNLLSNSIRHSPEHSTITLKTQSHQDRTSIQVTDHGCGIPKQALERVGERFFRVDSSRSKLYGGTGLGLSIAKSIVELHGGTMHITSEEGLGTTVDMQFPS